MKQQSIYKINLLFSLLMVFLVFSTPFAQAAPAGAVAASSAGAAAGSIAASIAGSIAGLDDCPDSTVSYWTFDNQSSEDVYGSSNATISGGSWVDGVVDDALSLDGSDGYASIADSDSFSFGDGSVDSPFSVAAWVYFDDDLTKQRIVGKADALNDGEWLLTTSGSDKLAFYMMDQSGGSAFIGRFWSSDLQPGQWYHVVGTYDGGGSAAGIRLYVDGVRVDDADSIGGTYVAMENTAKDVKIGKYGTTHLDGKVDEVAVFDDVLNSTEIQVMYNNGLVDLGYCYSYSPACGNDILDSGEECDDGNSNNGDGCSSNCTIELNQDCINTFGQPGMIAYWQADNSISDSFANWAGNASGSVAYTTGVVNQAFKMDGASGYVSIDDSDEFSFGDGSVDSPFSVAAWVYFDLDTTKQRIVGKADALNDGEWLLTTNGEDKFAFYMMDQSGGSTFIGRMWNTVPVNNQWYHVVGTYDGSGSADGIKLYVDGVRVDDANSNGGTYVAMENTDKDVAIGKYGSDYLDGKVEEVAIFDRVLNASEVYDMHSNSLSYQDYCDYYTAACGNGVKDVGEECDDGNSDNGDGCSSNCTIELNSACVSTFGQPGMIAYWQAEGNARDGYSALDGDVYSYLEYVQGPLGLAFDFDGVSDFVSIADSDIFSFGDGSVDSPFSVAAWVYFDDDLTKQRIVGKADALNDGEWLLTTNGEAKFAFYLMDQSETNAFIGKVWSVIPQTGQWYHVVGTYDGSGSADGVKLYVNAFDASSTNAASGSYIAMENTDNSMTIGTYGSDYLAGQVDEVAIFDRVLTFTEVQQLQSEIAINHTYCGEVLPPPGEDTPAPIFELDNSSLSLDEFELSMFEDGYLNESYLLPPITYETNITEFYDSTLNSMPWLEDLDSLFPEESEALDSMVVESFNEIQNMIEYNSSINESLNIEEFVANYTPDFENVDEESGCVNPVDENGVLLDTPNVGRPGTVWLGKAERLAGFGVSSAEYVEGSLVDKGHNFAAQTYTYAKDGLDAYRNFGGVWAPLGEANASAGVQNSANILYDSFTELYNLNNLESIKIKDNNNNPLYTVHVGDYTGVISRAANNEGEFKSQDLFFITAGLTIDSDKEAYEQNIVDYNTKISVNKGLIEDIDKKLGEDLEATERTELEAQKQDLINENKDYMAYIRDEVQNIENFEENSQIGIFIKSAKDSFVGEQYTPWSSEVPFSQAFSQLATYLKENVYDPQSMSFPTNMDYIYHAAFTGHLQKHSNLNEGLKEDFASLQTSAENLAQTLESYQGELSSEVADEISAHISNVQNALPGLNASINEIETEISTLQSQLDSAAANGLSQEEIDNLQNDLEELHEKLLEALAEAGEIAAEIVIAFAKMSKELWDQWWASLMTTPEFPCGEPPGPIPPSPCDTCPTNVYTTESMEYCGGVEGVDKCPKFPELPEPMPTDHRPEPNEGGKNELSGSKGGAAVQTRLAMDDYAAKQYSDIAKAAGLTEKKDAAKIIYNGEEVEIQISQDSKTIILKVPTGSTYEIISLPYSKELANLLRLTPEYVLPKLREIFANKGLTGTLNAVNQRITYLDESNNTFIPTDYGLVLEGNQGNLTALMQGLNNLRDQLKEKVDEYNVKVSEIQGPVASYAQDLDQLRSDEQEVIAELEWNLSVITSQIMGLYEQKKLALNAEYESMEEQYNNSQITEEEMSEFLISYRARLAEIMYNETADLDDIRMQTNAAISAIRESTQESANELIVASSLITLQFERKVLEMQINLLINEMNRVRQQIDDLLVSLSDVVQNEINWANAGDDIGQIEFAVSQVVDYGLFLDCPDGSFVDNDMDGTPDDSEDNGPVCNANVNKSDVVSVARELTLLTRIKALNEEYELKQKELSKTAGKNLSIDDPDIAKLRAEYNEKMLKTFAEFLTKENKANFDQFETSLAQKTEDLETVRDQKMEDMWAILIAMNEETEEVMERVRLRKDAIEVLEAIYARMPKKEVLLRALSKGELPEGFDVDDIGHHFPNSKEREEQIRAHQKANKADVEALNSFLKLKMTELYGVRDSYSSAILSNLQSLTDLKQIFEQDSNMQELDGSIRTYLYKILYNKQISLVQNPDRKINTKRDIEVIISTLLDSYDWTTRGYLTLMEARELKLITSYNPDGSIANYVSANELINTLFWDGLSKSIYAEILANAKIKHYENKVAYEGQFNRDYDSAVAKGDEIIKLRAQVPFIIEKLTRAQLANDDDEVTYQNFTLRKIQQRLDYLNQEIEELADNPEYDEVRRSAILSAGLQMSDREFFMQLGLMRNRLFFLKNQRDLLSQKLNELPSDVREEVENELEKINQILEIETNELYKFTNIVSSRQMMFEDERVTSQFMKTLDVYKNYMDENEGFNIADLNLIHSLYTGERTWEALGNSRAIFAKLYLGAQIMRNIVGDGVQVIGPDGKPHLRKDLGIILDKCPAEVDLTISTENGTYYIDMPKAIQYFKSGDVWDRVKIDYGYLDGQGNDISKAFKELGYFDENGAIDEEKQKEAFQFYWEVFGHLLVRQYLGASRPNDYARTYLDLAFFMKEGGDNLAAAAYYYKASLIAQGSLASKLYLEGRRAEVEDVKKHASWFLAEWYLDPMNLIGVGAFGGFYSKLFKGFGVGSEWVARVSAVARMDRSAEFFAKWSSKFFQAGENAARFTNGLNRARRLRTLYVDDPLTVLWGKKIKWKSPKLDMKLLREKGVLKLKAAGKDELAERVAKLLIDRNVKRGIADQKLWIARKSPNFAARVTQAIEKGKSGARVFTKLFKGKEIPLGNKGFSEKFLSSKSENLHLAPKAIVKNFIGRGVGTAVFEGWAESAKGQVAILISNDVSVFSSGRTLDQLYSQLVSKAVNENTISTWKVLIDDIQRPFAPKVFGYVNAGPNPAYAREFVKGIPLHSRFHDLANVQNWEAVEQYITKDTIKQFSAIWNEYIERGFVDIDFQFMIATEDQVINGFQFRKGDVIVIDAGYMESLSNYETLSEKIVAIDAFNDFMLETYFTRLEQAAIKNGYSLNDVTHSFILEPPEVLEDLVQLPVFPDKPQKIDLTNPYMRYAYRHLDEYDDLLSNQEFLSLTNEMKNTPLDPWNFEMYEMFYKSKWIGSDGISPDVVEAFFDIVKKRFTTQEGIIELANQHNVPLGWAMDNLDTLFDNLDEIRVVFRSESGNELVATLDKETAHLLKLSKQYVDAHGELFRVRIAGGDARRALLGQKPTRAASDIDFYLPASRSEDQNIKDLVRQFRAELKQIYQDHPLSKFDIFDDLNAENFREDLFKQKSGDSISSIDLTWADDGQGNIIGKLESPVPDQLDSLISDITNKQVRFLEIDPEAAVIFQDPQLYPIIEVNGKKYRLKFSAALRELRWSAEHGIEIADNGGWDVMQKWFEEITTLDSSYYKTWLPIRQSTEFIKPLKNLFKEAGAEEGLKLIRQIGYVDNEGKFFSMHDWLENIGYDLEAFSRGDMSAGLANHPEFRHVIRNANSAYDVKVILESDIKIKLLDLGDNDFEVIKRWFFDGANNWNGMDPEKRLLVFNYLVDTISVETPILRSADTYPLDWLIKDCLQAKMDPYYAENLDTLKQLAREGLIPYSEADIVAMISSNSLAGLGYFGMDQLSAEEQAIWERHAEITAGYKGCMFGIIGDFAADKISYEDKELYHDLMLECSAKQSKNYHLMADSLLPAII